jgi:hypothetical protein
MSAPHTHLFCKDLGDIDGQDMHLHLRLSRSASVRRQRCGERGLLHPGGTVVEGTAGITGIGLAHVCRSRGYMLVIDMLNTYCVIASEG